MSAGGTLIRVCDDNDTLSRRQTALAKGYPVESTTRLMGVMKQVANDGAISRAKFFFHSKYNVLAVASCDGDDDDESFAEAHSAMRTITCLEDVDRCNAHDPHNPSRP